MIVKVWTITGGSPEARERVLKLAASMPVHLNILRYAGEPLNIPGTTELEPADLAGCPVAAPSDTYFTANFNQILWNSIHDPTAEAVLILNDDVEFEPGAYEKLIAEAEAYPDPWAVFNPIQVDYRNPRRVIMCGTGAAYPGGMHMQASRDEMDIDQVSRWRWLPFCAPLLNLDAVRSIGLLDRHFRMYFSDSDFCIRARYGGFDVVLAREAAVKHINHATAQAGGDETIGRIFLADQVLFAGKWGGTPLQDLQ